MSGQTVDIMLKARMDISDIQSKTGQLQKSLGNLNLGSGQDVKFKQLFAGLDTELAKVQQKMSSTFKSKGDITSFEKSIDSVTNMFNQLNIEIGKINDKDLRNSLKLDTTEINNAKQKVTELQQQLSKKVDTAGFKEVEQAIRSMGSKSGFKMDFKNAFSVGDIDAAKTALTGLLNNLNSFKDISGIDNLKVKLTEITTALANGNTSQAQEAFKNLNNEIQALSASSGLKTTAQGMTTLFSKLQELQGIDLTQLRTEMQNAGIEVDKLTQAEFDKLASQFQNATNAGQQLEEGMRRTGNAAKTAANDMYSFTGQMDQLKHRIQYFFSLTNSVMLFRRAITDTINTVKKLDAAMAETAVVTDFSIGDMWDQLPRYTKAANELGTTTLGAYETMTLFYQQGLETNEVFEIGTETMKMARIAGIEYADATNLMTAALRGFNMELNETSATRINDVYSELAAITAADTNEIATAMTKTASIAANANMEFETTAALLSQIIETTREPAETAGTAMKTIIARFTEMKKSASEVFDVDGEEVNVNKVEAALKSAGVALRDAKGEFRDLDDVFLELSSKWDSLDKMTQRYVATMAAGSRQQSRFIAMMQDYERTMQLVDAAYNSSGSSQKQFEKTQESLESKLNKLKNAWDEFLMGIANSSVIKAGVDLLTGILNVVNKITGAFGDGAGGVLKFAAAIGTLAAGSKLANKALIGVSSYAIGIKEMTSVKRTGTLLNGDVASQAQVAAAMKGDKSAFVATQATRGKIASARNAGNLAAKQSVINSVRANQTSQQLAAAKATEASLIARQSGLAASGRLTPGLDEKFTMDIKKARVEVAKLEAEMKRLNAPISLDVLTEKARAEIETLETSLKADPMNQDLILQLETARAQLEVFEQAEQVDDIDKVVTADTTVANLELEAFEKKEELDPIRKPVVTSFMGGFKGGKTQNWFKGADSAFNTGLTSWKNRTNNFFNMFKKGSGTATKAAGKLGGKMAAAGGTAAKGLGAVIGVLKGIPGYGWAAAAAIAAVAGAAYAVWYNSSAQVAKRIAATDQMALKNTQKEVDVLRNKINEVDNAWSSISSAQEALGGMVQGTYEWTKQMQSLKQEIQDLVALYPELYQYLTIDPETGAWTLDSTKMQDYLNQKETDLDNKEAKLAFQKMIADSTSSRADAMEKNRSQDSTQHRNLYQSYFGALIQAKKGTDDHTSWLGSYRADKDEIGDLDIEVNGNEIDTEYEGKAAMEAAAADADFLTAEDREWIANNGTRRQKAALEFYDSIADENAQASSNYDASVRTNLAGRGYDAEVIDAVANAFAYGEDSIMQSIIDKRKENKYDGGSKGWGISLDGDTDSVRSYMLDHGFVEVDDSKQHYFNPETEVGYNVDETGGSTGKTTTIKYGGKEYTVDTISDETVRDWMEVEKIYDDKNVQQLELANKIQSNPELLKLVKGDLTTNVSQFYDHENGTWKTLKSGDGTSTLLDYGDYADGIKQAVVDNVKEMSGLYAGLATTISEDDSLHNQYAAVSEEKKAAMQDILDFRNEMGVHAETGFGAKLEAAYSMISDNREILYGTYDATANAGIKQAHELGKAYQDAGINAENFKEVVGQIGLDSSAISNAKVLNDLIEEGGELSEEASLIWNELGGEEKFGFSAQIKELASSEAWKDISAGLSSVYQATGDIKSDNIRELAESNASLASIMETTGMRAGAMAELMEDVEAGEISLMEITEEVANSYKILYNSVDLAGDALARIKKIKIGDTNTEIGKIYGEDWRAVQDLFKRGAYGDTQIDDYMSQMVGQKTWEEQLTESGGNKYAAANTLNEHYGLSKNVGNMRGSLAHLLKQEGAVASGENEIFSIGANGKINYDFSNFEGSSEDLINLISEQLDVTKDYAETLLADMGTYSKTLSADLQKLDAKKSIGELIKARTDSKGNVNITDKELEKYTDAFGTTVEKLKDSIKVNNKTLSSVQVDRTYSKNKDFYSEKQEDGTTKASFVDTKSTQFVKAQDAISTYTTSMKAADATEETKQNAKEKVLDNDVVLEIAASTDFSDTEKSQLLSQLDLEEPLIQDLLADTELINTKTQLQQAAEEFETGLKGAIESLKENEVVIPIDFYLAIKITDSKVAKWLGLDVIDLESTGSNNAITIGGPGASVNPSGGSDGGGGGTIPPPSVDLPDPSGNQENNGTIYDKGDDEDSTGNSSSGSKTENNTDPRVTNIDKKIDALDRKLERREINAVEHKLAKDELYQEKKNALEAQRRSLEAEVDYLGKYYKYDAEADTYLYLEEAYNNASDETKNLIDEEINELNEVNDELNDIEDAIEDFEFKDPYDERRYYKSQGMISNYNQDLDYINRKRNYNQKYGELTGYLPSGVSGIANVILAGSNLTYGVQEAKVNTGLQQAIEEQMRAKYNDSEYAGIGEGKYYYWDSITQGFKLNEDALADTRLNKETRDDILEEYEEMQNLASKRLEIYDSLYGGVFKDSMKKAAKALKQFSREVSDNDFDNHLIEINTGFKKLDEALNKLVDNLSDNDTIEKILSKKIIPGLGWGDKELQKLLENEKIVNFLGKSGLGPLVSEMGWGNGISVGQLLSFISEKFGDSLGGFADLFSLDMLSTAGEMYSQMQALIEQIIGKVAEVTGALIDAWTNREDILYNFLNVLERYLHDYEVMQRYSTQLEKGRMASVDDIRQNWEQQWQSLQDQLEMQQERIETRQDQLDRSRWNPFQLISGWDPTSDSLYENRGVKMAFDLLISAIGMLPMGLGAFGSQLNQLYEDYDKRVQEAYEDRLAAEMAILDIEDERLELVKIGAEEATEFEQKVLDALVQKEQEQIEELSRLNDAITNANSKLISTLQKNLDQIRQDRENEKKEEELGEKERRLAYLRQDTSGANMMEIKKLEEELEEGHEDYTDTLIDQKISELEKQNEAAAEQRQQQIDLLQAQLDWSQKYGLYWDAIYGMLYTIDENGNAVLNPENFDLDGNIRENSQLAQMLGTFSDRLGMSVWSSVLDNEEAKRLGRYYGAFIGNNGVSGEWADYWALLNPGADDPDYATPMPEIPDGIWGVLYRIETSIGKYFGSSNMGLWNAGERLEVGLKNILGDVFNIEEWANATAKGFHREDVIGKNTLTLMNGWNKLSEGLLGIADFGNKTSQSLTNRAGYNRHQNNGDNNISNYFNIGTVGENISLDDMVDKVSSALREVFSAGTNIVHHGR